MSTYNAPLLVSALTLVTVAFGGCVMDGELTGATGTAVFCVQDDPTVDFDGVFVNFGNIQINQQTTGNNTINDNDSTVGTTALSEPAANTTEAGNETANETTDATDDTNATASETTTTSTTTGFQDTETVPTTTAADEPAPPQSGSGSVETITVGDVNCKRLGTGVADMFRGQAGGNAYGKDETPDTHDSPCDDNEGWGNDWKCEEASVEPTEVNLLAFRDTDAALLAKVELSAGTIRDVSFDVEQVRVVMKDGTEKVVEVSDSNVQLQGPIEIREGHETLVVFKVDLESSLATGNDTETLVFTPNIRIRAATPVTETIVIEDTTTETVTATSTTNETATNATTTTPTSTMVTTSSTIASPDSETPTPSETTSASPTTNSTAPANSTSPTGP